MSPRDIVYLLEADAAGSSSTTTSGSGNGGNALPAPRELARTDLRCGGVSWGDDELCLVYESWWKTRRSVITMVSPSNPADGGKVLFDRNYEDVYRCAGLAPVALELASALHRVMSRGGH